MELLGLSVLDWGLVALVAFPLAQLPLVFYLARYADSEEEPLDHAIEFHATTLESVPDGSEPERASDRTSESQPWNARTTRRNSPVPSAIACPACGVENEPAFTFCRSCVARLSGHRSVAGPTPPR